MRLWKDAIGNRRLFWKEVNIVRNRGRNDCANIGNWHGRLLVIKYKVKKKMDVVLWWQRPFDLMAVCKAEVDMICFGGGNRVSYQGTEVIRIWEAKNPVRALKKGKAASLEVIGETIKIGGTWVSNQLWSGKCWRRAV